MQTLLDPIHIEEKYILSNSHLFHSLDFIGIGLDISRAREELNSSIETLRTIDASIQDPREKEFIKNRIGEIRKNILNLNLYENASKTTDPKKLEFFEQRFEDIRISLLSITEAKCEVEQDEDTCLYDRQKGVVLAAEAGEMKDAASDNLDEPDDDFDDRRISARISEGDENEDEEEEDDVFDLDGLGDMPDMRSDRRKVRERSASLLTRAPSMIVHDSEESSRPSGKSWGILQRVVSKPSEIAGSFQRVASRAVKSIFKAPTGRLSDGISGGLIPDLPIANQIRWVDLHLKTRGPSLLAQADGSSSSNPRGVVVRSIWNPDITNNPNAGTEVVVRISKQQIIQAQSPSSSSRNSIGEDPVAQVVERFKCLQKTEESILDKNCIVKAYGIVRGALPIPFAQLLSVPENTELVGVVLRYEEGSSLHEFIHNRDRDQYYIPIVDKFRLLAGVARGLAELHSIGIVHADLKPGNVLLSKDTIPKVRLDDFGGVSVTNKPFGGTIRQLTTAAINDHTQGTPIYSAPEMLHNSFAVLDKSFRKSIAADSVAKPSKRTDMYAFALVAWELLSEMHPFIEAQSESALSTMVHRGQRPLLSNLPLSCPSPVRELIRACWDADPTKRLSAIDCFAILQSCYFHMFGGHCDIFISLSHDDLPSIALAYHISYRLAQLGFRAAIDLPLLDDESDAELAIRIDESAAAARLFLYIVSPAYQESKKCLKRLSNAKFSRRPTIPLLTKRKWKQWCNDALNLLTDLRGKTTELYDVTALVEDKSWCSDKGPSNEFLSALYTLTDMITAKLPVFTPRLEDRTPLTTSRAIRQSHSSPYEDNPLMKPLGRDSNSLRLSQSISQNNSSVGPMLPNYSPLGDKSSTRLFLNSNKLSASVSTRELTSKVSSPGFEDTNKISKSKSSRVLSGSYAPVDLSKGISVSRNSSGSSKEPLPGRVSNGSLPTRSKSILSTSTAAFLSDSSRVTPSSSSSVPKVELSSRTSSGGFISRLKPTRRESMGGEFSPRLNPIQNSATNNPAPASSSSKEFVSRILPSSSPRGTYVSGSFGSNGNSKANLRVSSSGDYKSSGIASSSPRAGTITGKALRMSTTTEYLSNKNLTKIRSVPSSPSHTEKPGSNSEISSPDNETYIRIDVPSPEANSSKNLDDSSVGGSEDHYDNNISELDSSNRSPSPLRNATKQFKSRISVENDGSAESDYASETTSRSISPSRTITQPSSVFSSPEQPIVTDEMNKNDILKSETNQNSNVLSSSPSRVIRRRSVCSSPERSVQSQGINGPNQKHAAITDNTSIEVSSSAATTTSSNSSQSLNNPDVTSRNIQHHRDEIKNLTEAITGQSLIGSINQTESRNLKASHGSPSKLFVSSEPSQMSLNLPAENANDKLEVSPELQKIIQSLPISPTHTPTMPLTPSDANTKSSKYVFPSTVSPSQTNTTGVATFRSSVSTNEWECDNCQVMNSYELDYCEICETPSPRISFISKSPTSGFSNGHK